MSKTAILVDGGFFTKRFSTLLGPADPKIRADQLMSYCRRHLSEKRGDGSYKHELYRIFYYDCPPLDTCIFHPFLMRNINLKNTDQYRWMTEFISELYSKRKVAVRLGTLASKQAHYIIKPDSLKKYLNKDREPYELTEADFVLDVQQKGVDMRIGVDIASLAFKKQVDQIVLIAGDSDFVPAAKLARREGIDFVLDSLKAQIKPDLFEHIDGLHCCLGNVELAAKEFGKKSLK